MAQRAIWRATLRWGGRIAGAVVVLALLGTASAYGVSNRRGHRTYDVPEHALTVVADSQAIERGRHLATIRGCNECHAADMGGKVMIDDKAMGRLVTANLTNARSAGILSDRDWERAVRHGIRADSTPLNFMPSHEFTAFSDEDLAAIVAWTRSLPSVTRLFPPTRIGPLGRALHAAGALVLYPAERIDHGAPHPVRVVPTPDVSYGKYMAAGCMGCHGENYAGGKIAGAPPDWPAAGNLTPTGLASYSEATFRAALRTGKRPDGTTLRPPMDVRITGELTDVEVKALWAFFQSLPPRETGAR
ncbi:MAG: c-type cytochrome [Gemmatimonadaceae bacterium]|nr:c-type cytochrome [Gemmatimonadaceae bacterium]